MTLAVTVVKNVEFDPNGHSLSVDGAAPEFVPALFPGYEQLTRRAGLSARVHRLSVTGVTAHRGKPSEPHRCGGRGRCHAKRSAGAFEVSPDGEHTLRWLLTLLDRLGERAAAVRLYEDLARRLAVEHEVEPSPETHELMQTVRRRARPPAQHESPELALARAWFSAEWCGSCA